MTQEDASLTDIGGTFSLERNYSSVGAYYGNVFGAGWASPYSENLSFLGDGRVLYSAADGMVLPFEGGTIMTAEEAGDTEENSASADENIPAGEADAADGEIDAADGDSAGKSSTPAGENAGEGGTPTDKSAPAGEAAASQTLNRQAEKLQYMSEQFKLREE